MLPISYTQFNLSGILAYFTVKYYLEAIRLW